MDHLAKIDEEGAMQIVRAGATSPAPTPLTDAQQVISEAVRANVPGTPVRQPGFDVTQIGDARYLSAYLDELYVASGKANIELRTLTEEVAAASGGKPGFRTKPKDRVRAEEKITEYDGDASQLTDLAGSKIEYQSLDELYQGLEVAQQQLGDQIVFIKDRFIKPQDSGYRDILMNVRMSNGHIAEFRLHLAQIDEVADYEHALYEVRRSLKEVAVEQGREPTTLEQALEIAIIREEQSLFWKALQQGLGGSAP